MPELPEVETVRRQLNENIQGATIKSVKIRFAGRILPRNFSKLIAGHKILSIGRRAKIIIIKLSGDLTLLVHLKMTGRLLLKDKKTIPTKHTHVIFELSGKYDLHWEDVRKFGWLKLMTNEQAEEFIEVQKYGPEPFDKNLSVKVFSDCLKKRSKSKIKQVLMQQTCVAGLGNIYVTEVLWQAQIHPLKQISALTNDQISKLYRAIKSTLKSAIAARGTSADNYLDAYGNEGNFVPKLKAYGREGLPCPRCKTKLEKLRIGGRGSAYCPVCQKK